MGIIQKLIKNKQNSNSPDNPQQFYQNPYPNYPPYSGNYVYTEHQPLHNYSKEYYSHDVKEDDENYKKWRFKFNIFGNDDEKHAKNALTPYRVKQKLLMWNYGTGEKIYGYPVALIPRPHGEYIILYRRRMPSFWEEFWLRIKEIILGKKEAYRVVYVPEGCIGISDDVITIYAHSFRYENNFTEVAIPLEGNDVRKRLLYETALQIAGMYESALHKVMYELNDIIENALHLNPALRMYKGREKKEDKKGKQYKEFEGAEFSFDKFVKSLIGEENGRS